MKRIAMITLLAVGSVALASSLSVPWFSDNSGPLATLPPQSGTTQIVHLHNNLSTPIVCGIEYYDQDGNKLDAEANGTTDVTDRANVWTQDYSTFEIPAMATLAFRPVADDLCSADTDPPWMGQEPYVGWLVPNRPRYGSPGDNSLKKNGSIVITWNGDPTDVQGKIQDWSPGISAAYLLPPGA